ncbi:MAG: tetratricopeptide repeat protein [Planctomycetes bacterium]|nr:tetratricopeptide repeat protein [Planctomycetota bacterium]
MDDQSRRRLESLGYIGSTASSDSLAFDPDKKDAKDMIECFELEEKATYLLSNRKHDEALTICNKMIERWPEFDRIYFLLMRIAFETNQSENVIEHGLKILALTEKPFFFW